MKGKPATVKGSSGPLTEAHLRTLNTLIAACGETLQFCQACDECNINVDREAARTKEQLESARRIKARFFPKAV